MYSVLLNVNRDGDWLQKEKEGYTTHVLSWNTMLMKDKSTRASTFSSGWTGRPTQAVRLDATCTLFFTLKQLLSWITDNPDHPLQHLPDWQQNNSNRLMQLHCHDDRYKKSFIVYYYLIIISSALKIISQISYVWSNVSHLISFSNSFLMLSVTVNFRVLLAWTVRHTPVSPVDIFKIILLFAIMWLYLKSTCIAGAL